MQCIILAAGEGVRMRPHTLHTPKPMIKIAGKPLLAHTIDMLPPEIDEVIIVVGYLSHKIEDYFGTSYGGRAIAYVHQEEKLGTYHALELTKHLIKGREFMVLYADDIFNPGSLKKLLSKKEPAILLARVQNPERFGVVSVDAKGTVASIVEKPQKPESDLVSCGPLVLSVEIFNHKPEKSASGEYYLSESVSAFAKRTQVHAVEAEHWVPVGYPEDLERAGKFLEDLLK